MTQRHRRAPALHLARLRARRRERLGDDPLPLDRRYRDECAVWRGVVRETAVPQHGVGADALRRVAFERGAVVLCVVSRLWAEIRRTERFFDRLPTGAAAKV